MKYRNKKAIATLIVTTLIFTCGATGVQAAPAADLNIVGNVVAAPISGVSLAVAQANAQTAAEQAALVQNMGVAQIDNYLNVRSEASTDSEVVGIMKNNAVAEITGAVDGWYQITSGSVSGYVKAEYLAVGNQDLLNSVKTRMAQVNTETLKVRSEASTEAAVVTLVGQDQQLKVLDEQIPGWVKVETADGEGYISTEFASVADMYQYAEKPQVSEQKESSSGGSVTSYALQFLGNPYVWGGTSLTKGVDCSGFVMQVYAHYGISLPHSSSALRGVGRGVSYSEAQPGDIICYSGHVAIYLGGGRIVHASNPKDGIKVSTATYKKILAVRRVM